MQQHHFGSVPDYEQDFYAWTQHQAKVLRVLASRSVAVPDDLDIRHLAEEIEDLGSAELHAVESFIQQILVHLIKAASDSGSHALAHWRAEARVFSVDLRRRYVPSMRQKLDMQELWKDALDVAEARLEEHGAALRENIPADCPYGLTDMIADFNFDAALLRLSEDDHNPA